MPNVFGESVDVRIYNAGESVESGGYACTDCGQYVEIDSNGTILTACEKCGGTHYIKL